MRRVFLQIGTTLSALLVSLALATPAQSQTLGNVFVRGLGGITFSPTHIAGTYAADGGIAITHHIEVMGEFGRMANAVPTTIQQNLQTTALSVANSIGGPISFSDSVPITYGMGLVRVSGTISMKSKKMTPFVEGGVGWASVSSRFSAESNGIDESAPILATVPLPADQSKQLLAIGGGVGFPLSKRADIELGYRFSRVMTDDPQLNISRFYSGVRFKL